MQTKCPSFIYLTKISWLVIPIKNFDNQFLAVCQKQGRIKEPLLIDSNILKDYEKVLFKLLIEIFNPKIPFDQIEDKG